MRQYLAALLLGVALFLADMGTAELHHLGPRLPGIPNTPLLQNLIKVDGLVTWCVDSRAANYPGFVAQLHQVNEHAYIVSGIPALVVDATVGCDVWHTMPDVFPCEGASACIYYGSWPVVVAYNYRLGYTDWRTAMCHEGTNSGHAMGLHEHYDDILFKSLGRWWTCMDFGTGTWQMTEYDVAQVHSWLLPKQLTQYGVSAEGGYVWYCNAEPLVTTRVAVMYLDFPGEPVEDDVYYWSGYHMPVTTGCQGWHVGIEVGRCYFLNAENEFNWQRLRNDVLIGCT